MDNEPNAPTPEVLETVKAKFKKRMIAQIIVAVIIIPVVVMFALLQEEEPLSIFAMHQTTLLVIGFALILGALGFSLFNWRCPACKKYLGKQIYPKYCSKCGIELH